MNTAIGPPIPMMTIPHQKKEKGLLKQVTSKGGVEDNKEPEGLVSYLLTHFPTILTYCVIVVRSLPVHEGSTCLHLQCRKEEVRKVHQQSERVFMID
jgi:hypothetical protein